MHRTTASLVSILMSLVAGCASRPVPRVERLGDGLLKAPTAEEAEAYCRNSGDPTRLVNSKGPGDPHGEVIFRCD
jgi:hypothetical protein